MEDVLEVCSRAPRQDRPLVCLDEFANQLLSETRAPVAAIPRHLARKDYEYVREGSVSGALCECFEMHFTPKHGSWLNMAEIEIGLLGRNCLDRRIGLVGEFTNEVKAYLARKNEESKSINWQFTNEKARIKLKSLYPAI